MNSCLNISLISDDITHRQALAESISSQADFQVVSQVSERGFSLGAIGQNHPKVAVLGTHFPERGGFDLIRRLRTGMPDTRILVLSPVEYPEHVTQTLKAGAAGYLTTRSALPAFFDAIRKIAGNGHVIDPILVDTLIFNDDAGMNVEHAALTDREREVLCRIVNGKNIKSIANEMNLSAKTVSTHKAHLMQKLHMRSVADVVRYAIRHGIC